MQANNLSHPLSPQTAQDDSSLHAWEQLAQRAREFIEHGKIESALATQIKAVQVASRLLAGPLLHSHPDHCMAAWVVSHHNIAELLEERQQLRLAVDYLCDAHAGLTSLESAHASDPKVQQAALRHLRETHCALMQWQCRYGNTSCINAALCKSAHAPNDSSIPCIRVPSSHLH